MIIKNDNELLHLSTDTETRWLVNAADNEPEKKNENHGVHNDGSE